MAKVKLSAPWTTCYRQFQAFFKNDPSVKIVYNEDGPEIKLYVEDSAKAQALADLFNTSRTFGNVTLRITVVPANGTLRDCFADIPDSDLLKTALKGNTAVVSIQDVPQAFLSNPLCYVVFKKEVVQFFNDNLSDIHGLTSTLYQDLANEIFPRHSGVFFCTDNGQGNLGMPLGEWP